MQIVYSTTRVHSYVPLTDLIFAKRIDGYIFVSWILISAPLYLRHDTPDVLCLCATIPFFDIFAKPSGLSSCPYCD